MCAKKEAFKTSSLAKPLATFISEHPHFHIKQGTPEWIDLRKLGSTGVSKLLGIDGGEIDWEQAWNKAKGLYYTTRDVGHLPAVQFGKEHESTAIAYAQRVFPSFFSCYNLYFPGLLHRSWTVGSSEQPVCTIDATDSPDFILASIEVDGEPVEHVGEVKCGYTRAKFSKKTFPLSHYVQCVWHMMVADVPSCVFIDFCPGPAIGPKQFLFENPRHGIQIFHFRLDPLLANRLKSEVAARLRLTHYISPDKMTKQSLRGAIRLSMANFLPTGPQYSFPFPGVTPL